MKLSTTITALAFCLLFVCSYSHEIFAQEVESVKPFDQLVVSPYIDLILSKGPFETVRFEADNVPLEKVQVKVTGKTLRIYLDQAKVVPKQRKHIGNGYKYRTSIYEGAKVTAYVTYRDLEKLEIRGEQDVFVKDPLQQDKFKLKLFGASRVDMAGLQTRRLKAVLYGENDLYVKSGQIDTQIYRSYGENVVNAQQIKGKVARTRLYGESALKLDVAESLKVSALGESEVIYSGNPRLNKGLIIGASIRRTKD
ncbi:MAG: head GIN domain-containing protein [Cyclobacteriaceae bacterium]